MILMTFSERVKDYRKNKKISQEQLANMMGITRQSVSKWELGQAYPDTEKLIELSKLIGITVDELLKSSDKENTETISDDSSINNGDSSTKETEEDDFSVNLMLGGFTIGMALGIITDNSVLGSIGSLIGLGLGYIIEAVRKKK